MNSLRLKEKVTLRGRNFFGSTSVISLSPVSNGNGAKWIWSAGSGDRHVIDPRIVDHQCRRLRLAHNGSRLEIWEHIGVLRYFGLLGIEVESTPWPPYHGRAIELWDALSPFVQSTGGNIPWYTVWQPVRWTYPKERGGSKAYTAIYPSQHRMLYIYVTVSFAGLGTLHRHFGFPNRDVLEDVCRARTPGWPPYAKGISRAAALCGWPHHRKLSWPQDGSARDILDEFARHRAQDILGAASLLCRDGLFAGVIISHCSGHEADLKVIARANRMIIPA